MEYISRARHLSGNPTPAPVKPLLPDRNKSFLTIKGSSIAECDGRYSPIASVGPDEKIVVGEVLFVKHRFAYKFLQTHSTWLGTL